VNKKLWALNLILLTVVVYAARHVREVWRAEKAREGAELSRRIQPLKPPPFTPLPTAPPVVATGYAEIAQQDLFDRSRNPTVVIEQPAPPPPKPMPPLPVYHGQMNIGSGPMAIFSQTANSPHEAVHPGEPIGQFKLVDVNTEEVTLEWEGKVIHKKVDELLDRTASAQQPSAAPAAGRTEQPAAAAPPPAAVKSAIGPGADTGRGTKVCDPNDNMPFGTVVDGYRKTARETPFGQACVWEQVGR
jgi:hypothetical protein